MLAILASPTPTRVYEQSQPTGSKGSPLRVSRTCFVPNKMTDMNRYTASWWLWSVDYQEQERPSLLLASHTDSSTNPFSSTLDTGAGSLLLISFPKYLSHLLPAVFSQPPLPASAFMTSIPVSTQQPAGPFPVLARGQASAQKPECVSSQRIKARSSTHGLPGPLQLPPRSSPSGPLKLPAHRLPPPCTSAQAPLLPLRVTPEYHHHDLLITSL